MFVSVYFSPLAKFPGPAAAAATHLWKAYIELGKKESMCERAAVLHETYGMSHIIKRMYKNTPRYLRALCTERSLLIRVCDCAKR